MKAVIVDLTDMPTSRVVFRIDRSGTDRQVTAALPDESANPGNWVCYAHLGQHAECSPVWYNALTRPATPVECADLLTELRSIYESGPDAVKLVVRSRISNKRRVAVSA
jgi:hypothetical protein